MDEAKVSNDVYEQGTG